MHHYKDISAQKIDECVKKKMQDWEVRTALHMEQITWEWHYMSPHFLECPTFTKCFVTIPMDTQQRKNKDYKGSYLHYNMEKVKQIW